MSTKTTAKAGKRVFFTEGDELPIPDLTAHQKDSFEDFVKSGLREVFTELNPIDDYTGQRFSLSFRDYEFKEPKMTVEEAKYNMTTYEAPLHVTVELQNKVTGEKKEQDIYFGDYPWMTDRATFIINGTERVVVSQLIRSAGVFFTADNVAGKNYYGAKVIPGRGAWLEFETATNGCISVKIDRRRKIPVTTFLRSLGMKDAEIKKSFESVDNGPIKYIEATLDKDTSTSQAAALLEVYRRLRPGDLATVENAKSMIERTFFDYKRYDYSRVGRFKMNQRLGFDTPNNSEHRTLQMQDLVAIISEIIRLNNTQEPADDIDSLANRRVKLVGELVQRQFRLGMLRLQRNILDRMSSANPEQITPSQLLNSRPVVAAVKEFFSTSQLSQLMDETNPFGEIAHKRRLSSMGPGGLTRERAGFDVRDAHPTHYGRICTVETPEGGNVGLVLNLATYARINEYGFIEAPYRVVKNGKVTDEVVYVDAAEEENMIIADTSVNLDKNGKFVDEWVSARVHGQPAQVESSRVTHIDAAHKEILGVSASLIPFVEKNRVDRSLMACAMQKQAVPLLHTDAPTVGTGIEREVAKNTSQIVMAEADGVVEKADGDSVIVNYGAKLGKKEYKLTHFEKTNDDRCYNMRTVVARGQKVKKGEDLIEGASIANGELALGKNLLVAFMPWRGYNMDDAIVISRRLVEDDSLTSINIKDFDVEVRETKLGPEQVTRDIPNVSEHALRHLDENGIVTVGSEVSSGDILVGKITPKGETELSSEERLLRAIFGEKAKDVRDTSVRMTSGTSGKVVGVRVYTRDDENHELKAGVIMQIKIFVAEMRKIQVGDKLSGRHGNKGVVSRILPVEDMPFTEDGTPIDIVLSPMGVPSRMNLGQLFEIHLGMAARALGYEVATPSFNGVPDEVISDELEKAGIDRNGRIQLYDGLTGEPFNEKTSVGVMHMIKLHHMVEDKIHARSTGPYTMVTQQPLGGKAQNGGQRFGEMEVWALEAYGASATLQEMLTIKSDDVYGRAKAYESIIKHEAIEGPKLPEGFNVLVKELQGLGLKVDLLDNGESTDADSAIERTSREIERAQDDRLIYDKHNLAANGDDTIDLTSEESQAVLDEEGITITNAEGEEIAEEVAEEESYDDGAVDFGDEGEEL
ncbi:DNA-directed RNA polymerase subunit beta [Candidatus Saccharibacteria bacterium]|nr:DNA-directed RNA polymerase subunit beta [Candidatus Saccharibacteria bacterium]